MSTAQNILAVILLVSALIIIVAVLLQSNKSKGLSGTIAGGSETYFGKNKGKSLDKKLSVITTVLAIIFIGVVLTVYFTQYSWIAELLDFGVTFS
ncbi:MAG: preprotein translocase subunit SecG [Clostridia bacterium]|nr:preprotein translocase subunit SecG [Clostridia bacterium]